MTPISDAVTAVNKIQTKKYDFPKYIKLMVRSGDPDLDRVTIESQIRIWISIKKESRIRIWNGIKMEVGSGSGSASKRYRSTTLPHAIPAVSTVRSSQVENSHRSSIPPPYNCSVADPDDPYVLGPPGSGSVIQS
jgi:hypothetical protein